VDHRNLLEVHGRCVPCSPSHQAELTRFVPELTHFMPIHSQIMRETKSGQRRLLAPRDVIKANYGFKAMGAISEKIVRARLKLGQRLECPICRAGIGTTGSAASMVENTVNSAYQVCTDHIIDGVRTINGWQRRVVKNLYYNPATLLTLLWHLFACPATCTGCHRKFTFVRDTHKEITNTDDFVEWLLSLRPDQLRDPEHAEVARRLGGPFTLLTPDQLAAQALTDILRGDLGRGVYLRDRGRERGGAEE
jgi:hypothetical protein